MTRTICIEVDDQGAITVGEEPPDAGAEPAEGSPEDMQADKSYMQPARDVADALAQAKQLLEQPQADDGGPSPFQKGFAKVAKTGPGSEGMGGPDMGGM